MKKPRFHKDEDAAVSIDWVVLVAVLVVMIAGVFLIVTPLVYEDAATHIASRIAALLS